MSLLNILWVVISVVGFPFYLILSIIYGLIEYALGIKVKKYPEEVFTPKGAVRQQGNRFLRAPNVS